MPATARERLIDAAVEAFAEKGFAATTTRDIASRAQMSPAAVYVHHDSKESLLFTVSTQGHQAALAVIERATAGPGGPSDRLANAIHDFSAWHASNTRVGRIVQNEFNALSPEHRAEIAQLRRATEAQIRSILNDGLRAGVFEIDDVPGTARALLSLSIDLLRWFSPAGTQSPADIAKLHGELAVRMTRALPHDGQPETPAEAGEPAS